MQLIAGIDGPAEAAIVDGHEIDQLAFGCGSERVDHEDGRRLRHRLDDQDARHDRRAGEMSLKIGLADADVLDADGALVGIHLDDAVDHQEGVAMRDHLHDPDDIGLHAQIRGGGGFAHCLCPLSSLFSLTLPP